jgi:integrase
MLDGFTGSFVVQSALNLAPLVFCRPSELRNALWADIHVDDAEWRYYVKKVHADHLVPLSNQAIKILQDLHPLTGDGTKVFPGRSRDRSMSDAAINAALRRLGIDTKTTLTGHGFRAMARTILHERLRYEPAVIEHQLSHRVADPLGEAYNRTKFIDVRKEMMQTWADYLDELKANAKTKAKANSF